MRGVSSANEDRVGRPVAGEALVRQRAAAISSGAVPRASSSARDLGFGLAAHQRLGLREEVGEQDRVVLAERVVASGPGAMKSQGIRRVPWWMSW